MSVSADFLPLVCPLCRLVIRSVGFSTSSYCLDCFPSKKALRFKPLGYHWFAVLHVVIGQEIWHHLFNQLDAILARSLTFSRARSQLRLSAPSPH